MINTKLISKESRFEKAAEAIRASTVPKSSDMISIVSPSFDPGASQEEKFRRLSSLRAVGHGERLIVSADTIKEYGSAWDVPRDCQTAGRQMSVREMIDSGLFGGSGVYATANTLPEDWATLWDAMRIDISIRKAALDTVRQNFYNISDMPNSDRTFNISEFFPYATIFEENNGEGQSVNQGETRGGQTDTATHLIYSAGWTWTLLAELFDRSLDPEKLSDSVLMGYNLKRDDIAISPILNFAYSGAQQTAADTSGANRDQKLHRTIENAVDALGERLDPILNRKIDANGTAILASSSDARHIARIIGGLPSVNEQLIPAITEVSRIVSYDTEIIEGRVKNATYTGVTPGKCYLIKQNRYMNIGVKRNLTLEVDQIPDVSTLSREKRAWYYAEALYTHGIQYFIQEITLPVW